MEQYKQQETQPQTDGGEVSRRTLLFGGGVIFAGVAGIMAVDKLLDKFRMPSVDISGDLGGIDGEPPEVTAEIDPLTYEVEGTFEMKVTSRIGVAVGVRGRKDGALWGLFGATDAHIDKKIFGDYLLAADEARLNNSLVVEKQDDKILSVTATLEPLTIFQPRVDFTDFRNYVEIKSDDSPEEMQEKIDEFLADGSNLDESNGFECMACSTDAIMLSTASQLLTQYAIAIDAKQPDIIKAATMRYQRNMIQQLSQTYGLSPEKVKVNVQYEAGTDPDNPPTDEEITAIYKQRITQVYEESFKEGGDALFKVVPEVRQDDDGNHYVYAQMTGGSELWITLSNITYDPEIRDLLVSNITELGEGANEEVLTPPTTVLGPVGVDPDYQNGPLFDEFTPTTTILGPVGVDPSDSSNSVNDFLGYDPDK